MEWLYHLEIIKLLRHLGFACLPVSCLDLCQRPSSILRLVFAFIDGQGPREKPIPCPQPANTPKDSIPEQINFRAPLLLGWSAEDQPRVLVQETLDGLALQAQEPPRSWAVGRAGGCLSVHSLEDEGRPTLAHPLPAPSQLAGPLSEPLSELQ